MRRVLAYGRVRRHTGPSGVEIVLTSMTSATEAGTITVSTNAHRVEVPRGKE